MVGQGLAGPRPRATRPGCPLDRRHHGLELGRQPLGDLERHRVEHVVERVEPRLDVQRPSKHPAEQQGHHPAGQQDADVFAQEELPPADRLADDGDGRPPLDLLVHRDAGRQQPEQSGEEHHAVEPDLLHQFVVVAEGEVWDEGRDHNQKGGQDGNKPGAFRQTFHNSTSMRI